MKSAITTTIITIGALIFGACGGNQVESKGTELALPQVKIKAKLKEILSPVDLQEALGDRVLLQEKAKIEIVEVHSLVGASKAPISLTVGQSLDAWFGYTTQALLLRRVPFKEKRDGNGGVSVDFVYQLSLESGRYVYTTSDNVDAQTDEALSGIRIDEAFDAILTIGNAEGTENFIKEYEVVGN